MTAEFQNLRAAAGQVLFCEEDEGDCAYAIIAGQVEITVERNGKPVSVATLGPGEIFGEMAIISSGKRSATATVVEDCVFHRIQAGQFHQRIEKMDPVMRMTIDVILSRFRTTLQRIEAGPPALREIALAPMPHVSQAMENLRLENEIASAVNEEQFIPYYQPIVCLETGKLAGFEALLRWQHPIHGVLSPDRFIPASEQTDLISRLTRSCLINVSTDLREMRIACLKNVENVMPAFVSVNITGRDLDRPEFVHEVEATYSADGLTPNMLKLEITESSLMTDLDKIREDLTRLRDLGIEIAIDDFGTGYSSMSHLAKLPVSTLKIDRCFVTDITENLPNRKIVKTIVRLAKELGLPIIAEGISSPADAAWLAGNKCEFGQGFLYSQPVPLADALAMIQAWDSERRELAVGGQPKASPSSQQVA